MSQEAIDGRKAKREENERKIAEALRLDREKREKHAAGSTVQTFPGLGERY